MYVYRKMSLPDIDRLVEIRPGFIAHTVIKVIPHGTEPFMGWTLREEPLDAPFNKGHAYDFDPIERQNIYERYGQPDSTLLEVVEDAQTGRLVGVLDVEEEHWRRTAWVWNLMLDVDARGKGIGRQLVDHTITWAKQHRLRAILLETQSNNTPACHFYARMGFKLIGVNTLFYTNHDLEKNEVALFWGYPL